MKSGAAAKLESLNGEALFLEEVNAEATVRDLFAEVTVTQRYHNPEPSNIEAVYTFPLPLDAVLLGFEVKIGDRKLAGNVVAKAAAELHYEAAITGGDTAVLLEQAGPGLFTASLGNLLAGEKATIRFCYAQFLRWNGDRIRLVLPTTIAPRYGDPAAFGLAHHQVPEYSFDAERSFSLKVAVDGLLSKAHFASPTHDVVVTRREGKTHIDIAGRPAMDRDFVLEARAANAESCGALASEDVDGRWVSLASFRPVIPSADARQQRSVKVVVDCSGSMAGDSIGQARLALSRILVGLHDGDFFDIIAFGTNHRALFGKETEANEASLAEAQRFVRGLDADMGGTEIAAALDAAYALRNDENLPRDLLLITDGEVWNDDELLARARKSGHQIFTVGVGSAVAETLVRELAEASGGACELVTPREDMAERIHRHFQRLYAPAATRAAITWPAQPQEILPRHFETVFDGDTLHALAWFDEVPRGKVCLEIELADGRVIRHDAELNTFTGKAGGDMATDPGLPPSLARIAAARRLIAMTDGETATELAVRYQLVSRWTNYLVVHLRADGEKCDDLPRIRTVPQMVAAGWHGMGTAFYCRAALTPDMENAPFGSSDSWGHEEEVLASRPRARPSQKMQWTDLKRKQAAPVKRVNVPGPDRCTRKKRQTATPLVSADASCFLVADLIARLNSLPALTYSPDLNDLRNLGVPESVLTTLEAFVNAGAKEEQVATAFLKAIIDTEDAKVLNRHVRRKILKAFRSTAPNQALVVAVGELLREWEGESEMAEDTH